MFRFFDIHLKKRAESEGLLFEDSFAGKLAPGWWWGREDRKSWRVADGALEIRVQPGGLWGGGNNAKNVLVRKAPDTSKRKIASEVTVSGDRPTGQYEQAGMAWYYDDSHMVKLVKELVNGELKVVMGREEADRCRTLAILPLETPSVQLRFLVMGDKITGQFRPAGKGAWKDVATCELPAKGEAKISLHTYNGPPDAEHWGRFTRFRVARLKS